MISRKNILELKSRREIYQFISRHPGLKVHEISKKLDIPRSTTRYHLNYLTKINLITNKNGKKDRYYIIEIGSARDKDIIGLLRQQIPFYIIMNLFFPGFCSEIELAQELEVHPSTIHFHIKKLLDIGLIKPAERKDGGFISFVRNEPIVLKEQTGREIFYSWNKDNKSMEEVYRLLITHKESMIDPDIIDKYNEFCALYHKIFNFKRGQKYFIFLPFVDRVIDIVEEILPNPYRF